MPTFLFRAENAKTDEPVKVHITLGGVARGYTPERKNQHLEVTTAQSGTYSWFARRNGETIKKGESSGGEVVVFVT
jgi:hypothetical protein